jgi:hypothetical protein
LHIINTCNNKKNYHHKIQCFWTGLHAPPGGMWSSICRTVNMLSKIGQKGLQKFLTVLFHTTFSEHEIKIFV